MALASSAFAAGLEIPRSTLQVCFAPPIAGGCDPTRTIVEVLGSAHKEVLVQAYELSSREIVEALMEAAKRGVSVKMLLDRSGIRDNFAESSDVNRLIAAGVTAMIDSPPGIAHNKVMIIDGAIVITGSFNYTHAAETRNAENLLVIRDEQVAAIYAANWKRRAAISRPIDSAATPPRRTYHHRPRLSW